MKRRFYGMTIGIGLICQNGVVLASDSRTEGDSGRKRFDLNKIEEVKCAGMTCLIARSGMTSLSGRAVELIRAAIAQEMPKDRGQLLEIARKSVAQVRRDFLWTNSNLHYADPTGKFYLIVATHDGEPRLHVINSNEGALQPEESGAYIGTGEILADYILGGLDTRKMNPDDAVWAALYAVEIAKLKDSDCEGPTKLALIGTSGNVVFFPDDMVADASEKCARYESTNRDNWIKDIMKWVHEQETLKS
jgi:20S proteasome alpha/beta subunit